MGEDAGVELWKEHSSASDRVRSIASALATPQPVDYIADEACVAESTAQDLLERLVDQEVLVTHIQDGTTLYAPDPAYARRRALQDLHEAHDAAELTEMRANLRDQIDTWREKYGVDSPAQLRSRAADTEDTTTTREMRWAAGDWELTLYTWISSTRLWTPPSHRLNSPVAPPVEPPSSCLRVAFLLRNPTPCPSRVPGIAPSVHAAPVGPSVADSHLRALHAWYPARLAGPRPSAQRDRTWGPAGIPAPGSRLRGPPR